MRAFTVQGYGEDRLEDHVAADLRIARVGITIAEGEIELREESPDVRSRVGELGSDLRQAPVLGVRTGRRLLFRRVVGVCRNRSPSRQQQRCCRNREP